MLRRSLSRRWYRLLGAGPLVLLLALSPSVLSIDHFAEYAGLIQDSEETPLDHIGHCHLNVASCADQPLPPNPGGAPEVVNVVEPELTSLEAPEEAHLRRDGNIVVPPTEPPRAGGARIEASL